MFACRPSGRSGSLDGERRPDPGQQRPDLPAAEDSVRTDPLLQHPADLSLHLREQEDGHHRQGVDLTAVSWPCYHAASCVVSLCCFFLLFSQQLSVFNITVTT